MSFAGSAALQRAVYQALFHDQAMIDAVGADIYDAIPSGNLPSLYVVLGTEAVKDSSDQTGNGAIHDFVVSIITQASGFSVAKEVGALVCDVLIDAPLILDRGTLVALGFVKAAAARIGTGDRRQINLTFRARISDA